MLMAAAVAEFLLVKNTDVRIALDITAVLTPRIAVTQPAGPNTSLSRGDNQLSKMVFIEQIS